MRLNEELCRAWRTNIWPRVLRNLTNSPIVTASLTILTVAFTDSSTRTIASLLNVEILSMDFFTARKLELESSISRPIANLHRLFGPRPSTTSPNFLSVDRTRSIGSGVSKLLNSSTIRDQPTKQRNLRWVALIETLNEKSANKAESLVIGIEIRRFCSETNALVVSTYARRSRGSLATYTHCVQHQHGTMEIVTRRMWARERACHGLLSMYIYGRWTEGFATTTVAVAVVVVVSRNTRWKMYRCRKSQGARKTGCAYECHETAARYWL